MSPNVQEDIPLSKKDGETSTEEQTRKYQIVYTKVLMFVYWHMGAMYGLYLCFSAQWLTLLFNVFYYMVGVWGVTVGAHRLWSHRSYKAKLPLQVLLMLFQSSTARTSVINWSKDHRSHHKFTDTDADPHDSTKGLFFSHMGWLMVKRHPDVIKKGKKIDMSDLYENPVLRFQHEYFMYISTFMAFILPSLISVYFWQENLNVAYHIALLRVVLISHVMFLINSAAHKYGYKPYDKNITSTQLPLLSFAALGEGYHNYHHVFPFDYRASELGNNYINFATNFIDFFAWIGWAYDLKHVPQDMIERKAKKSGDSSDLWGRMKDGNPIWGWGDDDMAEEDRKALHYL